MPMLPSSQASNNSLTSTKILLVEGKDEVAFCRAFLVTLNIRDVQIIDVGGSTKFSDQIKTFPKRTGFEKVQILGIVRDAESNPAQRTFESIRGNLKHINLPQPKKLKQLSNSDTVLQIGVFVLPDNHRTGMLEDLCLESLSGIDEIRHADEFFRQANVTEVAKDFSKRRVQAWLSIAQPSQSLQREVGRAAEAGKFWNFDHPCFADLKAFLEQFR